VREAATPTADAAGLQPAQDDGAKTSSDHQQPQPGPWCSNQGPVEPPPPPPLLPPRPKPTHLHGCTTGRCPAQLIVGGKENVEGGREVERQRFERATGHPGPGPGWALRRPHPWPAACWLA
jgi:hypothetical protein